MPYIRIEDRQDGAANFPGNAGELNYAITQLIIQYVGDHPSYQLYNDCLGALEGAKLELYRRAVAPYEDNKIVTNGDVYPHCLKHPVL